jgi:hypothetical protein
MLAATGRAGLICSASASKPAAAAQHVSTHIQPLVQHIKLAGFTKRGLGSSLSGLISKREFGTCSTSQLQRAPCTDALYLCYVFMVAVDMLAELDPVCHRLQQ